MTENECCCEELDEETCDCDCDCGCDCSDVPGVSVKVDVAKIVKYIGLTTVLITGIVFGTKCFRDMLKEGFFNQLEK